MRYIKVKNEFEGFHRWKDAPDEVNFLRNLHRHLFKVTTKISVDHNERALEFFIVQRHIDEIIEELIGRKRTEYSCEDMAEYILDYLEADYGKSHIEVEVSEDGENAGVINNYERFNE